MAAKFATGDQVKVTRHDKYPEVVGKSGRVSDVHAPVAGSTRFRYDLKLSETGEPLWDVPEDWLARA